MAYQKLNWLNKGETGAIPINKTNLNHMDDGIEQNSNDIANIIESGSNDNGLWIKFSDGTLICRSKIATSANETEKRIYFPVSFIDTNFNVIVTNIFSNRKDVIWTVTNSNKEYFIVFPVVSNTSTTPTSASSANYIAIGKWK